MNRPNVGALLADRFELIRLLGQGGMGEVWLAEDRQFRDKVALKLLSRMSPNSLDQFKREFRSIAELRHPNLVNLYELFTTENHAFFTMEYLKGDPLPTVLLGSPAETTRPLEEEHWSTPDALSPPARLPSPQEQRFLTALYQLSVGIDAIHTAGWIHRDLKLQNMIFTYSGRVVILDLGLAHPIGWEPQSITGTVLYMAPEQIQRMATPASDWYAFGVILYHLYSRSFPIVGTQEELLERKLVEIPPSLRGRYGIPEEMADLIDQLLSIQPEHRPDGKEVRRVLRMLGHPAPEPAPPQPPPPFIGRQQPLDQMRHRLRTPESALIEVYGPSGVGKTMLVERLLASATTHIQLRSRCRPEEHTAFKAVDAPMEQLCSWLLERPSMARHLGETLPSAIFHLFPTFIRLLPSPSYVRLPTMEPAALREEAFQAVIHLFQEIVSLQPVLLWIDDYQWVDADSGPLLRRLLAILPRGLFLLTTSRPQTPSLRAREGGDLVIDLAPLTREELLDLTGVVPESRIQLAWEQSGGLPMLFSDSLRDENLEDRLTQLNSQQRRILELTSLAAADLPRRVLLRALGPMTMIRENLILLATHRLLKIVGDGTCYEPAHDRIRDRILSADAATSQRRNELHEALFVALLLEPTPDLQALFNHCLGAGREADAVNYAQKAALQAEESLAFGTAAQLYQAAIRLSPETVGAHIRLAVCHRNLGALAEAAISWESAANLLATKGENQELLDTCRWRAAEAYLHSGKLVEGRAKIGQVLEGIGVRLPTTAGGALLRASWFRIRFFLGKWLGLHRRRPLRPEEDYQLSRLWSASSAFSMVEPLLSDALGAEHLQRASWVQDHSRTLRALGYEAAFEANFGGALTQNANRLLAEANAMCTETSSPYDRGWLSLCNCVVNSLQGRLMEAAAFGKEAERIFTRECRGTEWELAVTRVYLHANLLHLGEVEELVHRLRDFEASTSRRELFAVTVHRLGHGAFARAIGEDADMALDAAQKALEAWPSQGFSTQHFHGMLMLTQALLYQQRVEEACSVLEQQWGPMEAAHFLKMEWVRNETLFLRARAWLARQFLDPACAHRTHRYCAEALKSLDRCPQAYATAFASLIRAGQAGLKKAGEKFKPYNRPKPTPRRQICTSPVIRSVIGLHWYKGTPNCSRVKNGCCGIARSSIPRN